ncbi:MAG: disulfide bond formation protein DsbA [Caulobacter vibrioides]|uniref:Disulfide bond formation protein DsbA n=1 Tax=Caulobacter vibrioides TaxID=155892 RepID=A0A258CZ59_CAUVI|nr:MAG: disulfide bond formation protein DsbA [Caulobacter vibrioides]
MRAFSRWIIIAAAVGMAAACGPKGVAGAGADAGDMTLGDPNAKVTVVEYASVTCTHCATFNEQVWPAFKAKYVDTNKVNYVFKEFLTPPESVAAAGFLLARCAGEDKYFGVIDALFNSQNELFTTGDARGMLFRVGRGAGLTDDKITACIQDEKALAELRARTDKAIQQDKITGTPTFVINGKELTGEQTLAVLSATIDPLLK